MLTFNLAILPILKHTINGFKKEKLLLENIVNRSCKVSK